MELLNVNWSEPYKVNSKWQRDWLIPQDLRFEFFNYWKKHGFSLKAQGYSVTKKNEEWYLIESKLRKNLFDAPVEFNTKNEELTIVPIKDTSGLRTWQVTAVEKICASINKWNSAIDGSDTGTGKSYVACGVARELNLNILIVCPKAVMESWRRVIYNHFKMKNELVGIINYEMLRTGRKDSPYASYVKRRETRRKEFVWKIPKNTLIVWDESQKLKGATTKNSETCIAALKQGYKMLFCSATNATNPLELKTVGSALKLFENNQQYYTWLYEHGVTRGRFGLEFTGGKEHLIKLNKDIFGNRGIRLSRDTIPNFPESQIIAECYDIETEAKNKINKIYSEMQSELKKLKNKIKGETSKSVLTTILRARQEVELIKVPLFIEMIEEGIEDGMSVVVFCNFTETINALSERLNTKCIVNGDPKYEKYRQQNIDDFQNDSERIILVNIAAGGAGLSLHDINGKYPRLSLISPSYSAVQMRQSTGRVWRDSAKSKSLQKIIFVSGTIEERVCDSVNKKLENMDLLNDGDLT
jgi:hypothetical protein